MPSIEGYYEYAELALASYIRLEGIDYTQGVGVTNLASNGGQKILPDALANQVFTGADAWHIAHPYHNDTVGFAATLFERDGEKVLGIRGTEPSVDGQLALDLVQADLMDIGVVGLAIN